MGDTLTREVFESPRIADGELATMENCPVPRLCALHRLHDLARAGETSSSATASRRLIINVEIRRLPRGEEARHFYFSLWKQNGEAFVPLSEERLVAAARDDTIILQANRSSSHRQQTPSPPTRSPSPRPAAFVVYCVFIRKALNSL